MKPHSSPSTPSLTNRCDKCGNQWRYRIPDPDNPREPLWVECDCEGAVQARAEAERKEQERLEREERWRQEQERRAAEERAIRVERDAKCPECGGDGVVFGASKSCTCEYGRQRSREHLAEALPPRFKAASLSQFPDATVRACRDAIASGSGLLVHGGVGTGKTHLAVAMLYELVSKYDHSEMQFVPVPDLLDAIRATYNGKEPDGDILKRAQEVSVLVLDDFGTDRVTDWAREKVYQIINHRYNYELTTIITTNLSPSKLAAHVGDRIASRLMEMCRTVKVEGEDRRAKR
jgi:DNA replication protein DnaC